MIVLFSDGYVWSIRYNDGTFFFNRVGSGVVNLSGSDPKVEGDALYIADGSKVYVCRDSTAPWELDTAGLSGYVEDIAIDTNNYVWVATDAGVFSQHPDSSVWHKDTTMPMSYPTAIFVDRMNRIYVGGYSTAYLSTDGGATWTNALSGGSHSGFADDAFGNVYSFGGGKAYRSVGGTTTWTNISDSLASFGNPSPPSIRSLAGDTLLYAGTSFGVFVSSDQGTTWKYNSVQMPNNVFYGLVRSESSFLVSTSLGVFKIMDGDTIPTKVLPSSGFQSGITLTSDSAGRIYSIVSVVTNTDNKGYNYVSTDQGTTWIPDTLGLSSTGIILKDKYGSKKPYFVDMQGTQYAMSVPASSLDTSLFWIKRPGQPWQMDTVGLNLAANFVEMRQVSTNNRKGIVYALKQISYSEYALYKRSVNDSVWQNVDVSAFGSTSFSITSDNLGNVIVFTRNGDVSMYDGNTWTPISTPSSITDPAYADLVSVGNDGTIWSTFRLSSNFISRGLYFTQNGGTSWTYVGFDSTLISLLYSTGDSAYVVANGTVYLAATTPITSSGDESWNSTVSTFELMQNFPNPFNPTTTISFTLPKKDFVVLKIFDILGREVQTIVSGEMEAGKHAVQFDASRFSSGVYLYRLAAGNFQATRKLLLLK